MILFAYWECFYRFFLFKPKNSSFINSKNSYKIISLFQSSISMYWLERFSHGCYKFRRIYNRNADTPWIMVVLAAFSVSSVDCAMQWVNQYSPKHKIGNCFCPLCTFHSLELFPFYLPMCYLHPRFSHPISLFFTISSGLCFVTTLKSYA